MYLKSLEMIGFKSFADKTKLVFEPGMTAVVGPNGCGKSNVSDAVRWVIGEQSAKALRGSSMADIIFNGTDQRKPLAMTEVSLTLSDCESALGTDFNEVTVTRRVFRSGEGQYFLNRTPCRLRDIQRLFMDTGVGTTSYSVMEQGRIDRILSSRPEDRRAVFEEASGITKYKADKKEAIRKLEHTEANLLRLADVIQEVKRQIGSLQRQAGKARRYKEYKDQLRVLDLFTTRHHLTQADQSMAALEKTIASVNTRLAEYHRAVDEMEAGNQDLRDAVVQTEREIGSIMEAGVHARSKLDRTNELIKVNRQRITEYRAWSERDTLEIDATRLQLDEKCALLESLTAQIDEARAGEAQSGKDLKEHRERFDEHQRQIDSSRTLVHRLRDESVQLESLLSRLQNELVELETRERASVLQRERLSAERAQLERVASDFGRRKQEMEIVLKQLTAEVAQCLALVQTLESRKADNARALAGLQEALGEIQRKAAGRQAQIDLLRERDEAGEGFSGGARLILDEANPLALDRSAILGALASQIEVEPEFGAAVEAALRAWMDAVVIRDAAAARHILAAIQNRREGSARLLAADAPARPAAPDGPGDPLLAHIRCRTDALPIVQALIGHMRVITSLDEAPDPVPAGGAFVTRDGTVIQGNGCMEYWMTESGDPNPLARRRMLAEAERALAEGRREQETLQSQAGTLRTDLSALDAELRDTRLLLDDKRRTLAQNEGEAQVLSREGKEARERLETVSWELENLLAQGDSGETQRKTITGKVAEIREQREKIAADIAEHSRSLQQLESRHAGLQAEVTERRIALAGLTQKVEHLASQRAGIEVRIKELDSMLKGRSAGIQSYDSNIARLTEETRLAENEIASLEQAVLENEARALALQQKRAHQAVELKEFEAALHAKRVKLEELREEKAGSEIRLTESRVRRQNLLDRITGEYRMTEEALMTEELPDWGENGAPPVEEAETQGAELRAKLEAIGPVNLVAIEEHKELEERYTFLTEQEDDLLKAKQQLMDLIRKINGTTTEMFSETFNKVNENFQDMFNQLFGGGTAKLVLVDEEDILECGIEIIARPPGKRLQNISLLSGGERTMTAVALLFGIYMIKPSPFCMLDELDAALDESNIGRFTKVLQGFIKQSQFIVITHNQHTISAADTIYGVTMPEKGVSRVVSMRFKDHGREREPELVAAET